MFIQQKNGMRKQNQKNISLPQVTHICMQHEDNTYAYVSQNTRPIFHAKCSIVGDCDVADEYQKTVTLNAQCDVLYCRIDASYPSIYVYLRNRITKDANRLYILPFQFYISLCGE